ncbi:hypothetical protein P3S67_016815 [Capsicum chacoense]
MAATRLNDENTWFLDSACTQHMTSKQKYFMKLESAKVSVKLAKLSWRLLVKELSQLKLPKILNLFKMFCWYLILTKIYDRVGQMLELDYILLLKDKKCVVSESSSHEVITVEMIKRSLHLDWNSNSEQVCQSSQCEQVIVTTKHNDDEQYIWESQTDGSFTITRDVNAEQLGRGTKITLFLKEDQLEYLEEWRIKDLVKKHSESISYPIYLWDEKTTEKEISNDEDDEPKKNDEPKKDGEGSSKQDLLKLTQDQGGNYLLEFDSFPDRDQCRDVVASAIAVCREVGKDTFEKHDVPHDEQLSTTEMGRRIKLLQKLHRQLVIRGILSEVDFWAARKSLLEQTENKNPKQRVALKNDMWCVKPLSNMTPEVIHQIFAEKPAVCQAYLNFIPVNMSGKEFWTKCSRAEYLYNTKNIVATFAEASEDKEHAVFLKQDAMLAFEVRKKMNNIKLYVWRMFIMDNHKEFIPEYLGFLKGVVDFGDLPPIISHEMLQQNNILKVIRKNLVNKCIEMFSEIAENKEGLKLAYIFTKALPKFRFENLREQLGVTSKHLKEEC